MITYDLQDRTWKLSFVLSLTTKRGIVENSRDENEKRGEIESVSVFEKKKKKTRTMIQSLFLDELSLVLLDRKKSKTSAIYRLERITNKYIYYCIYSYYFHCNYCIEIIVKILTLFLMPHLIFRCTALKAFFSFWPTIGGINVLVKISEFSGTKVGSNFCSIFLDRCSMEWYFTIVLLVLDCGELVDGFAFAIFKNVGNPCSSNPPE